MNALDKRETTKSRIRDTAILLFAENGFEATSVREIASAADVNVAAINYHFGNKAGLYEDIIESSYVHLKEQISELGDRFNGQTEEFVIDVFRLFLQQSKMLVNTFKVFLTVPQELDDVEECQQMDGPPGHEALEACIRQELGNGVSQGDLTWAAKILFSQMIHVVLLKSSHCATRPQVQPLLETDVVEGDLRRLTRCVLRDLS